MQKNLNSKGLEKILEILEEEGIVIPLDFEENLQKNAEINYGGEYASLPSVRAVIKICNYWRRYCADINEFSKLVCTSIYSMFRIHAAVIGSNKFYLGDFCKLKEGVVLPENTTTIATSEGATIIYQGYGENSKAL